MQTQVFFTALFAFLTLGEALRLYKVAAITLGLLGMAIVAAQQAAIGKVRDAFTLPRPLRTGAALSDDEI